MFSCYFLFWVSEWVGDWWANKSIIFNGIPQLGWPPENNQILFIFFLFLSLSIFCSPVMLFSFVSRFRSFISVLFLYLSLFPSVFLFVQVSFCCSVCPLISLSFHLSRYLSFFRLTTCSGISLSFYLFSYSSIFLSVQFSLSPLSLFMFYFPDLLTFFNV